MVLVFSLSTNPLLFFYFLEAYISKKVFVFPWIWGWLDFYLIWYKKQKFCKLCRVPLVISIWEKWSRLHLRLKNFTEELSMSRALGHCSLTNITGPLSPRALRLDSCFHIINIVCLCLTVTRDLKLWLELSCARSCPGFFLLQSQRQNIPTLKLLQPARGRWCGGYMVWCVTERLRDVWVISPGHFQVSQKFVRLFSVSHAFLFFGFFLFSFFFVLTSACSSSLSPPMQTLPFHSWLSPLLLPSLILFSIAAMVVKRRKAQNYLLLNGWCWWKIREEEKRN